MTLETTHNRHLYDGDGTTTRFVFTFRAWAVTDFKVKLRNPDGSETLLVRGSHYDVTINPSGIGGYVDLLGAYAATPPTSSMRVLVMRELPMTQTTDWEDGDAAPADVLEGTMDRTVALIQQLSEKVDRTIQLSETGENLAVDPVLIAQLAAQASEAASDAFDARDDSLANRDAAAISAAQAAASAASLNLPAPSVADAGKSLGVNSSGAYALQDASSVGSDLYLFNTLPALGGSWR